MNNTDWSLGSQKTIALVAHDNMKKDLINWVKRQKDLLAKHILCGTGTTSKLISETTGLPVKSFKSGPLGGDQQIGARIAEGEIDFMIFFWDPLKAQPHDPDVKALLRIAVLYDIPIANNKATADFLILSPLMDKTYDRHIVDSSELMEKRNKESFGM